MTAPSLYWYFPSKPAILQTLVRQTLDDFLDAAKRT